MTPLIVDPNGRATIASAEGQAALDRGNTDLARKRHAEAARIIEEQLGQAKTDKEKSLNRFLAATQYYKGGDYQKAYALARKVRKQDLAEGVASLLPDFLKGAERRSAADYVAQIEETLKRLWNAKQYQGVIELLQDHPYVFAPRRLATIRGMCCEGLGMWRPAVLFFRDAHGFEPDDPTTLSALAPLPLRLAGEGRSEEAWRYVKEQVELFPNAVSHALAANLCYLRARNAEGNPRAALFEKQDCYFDLARGEFARRLPNSYQRHVEVRAALGLGYDFSALGLLHSGASEAALKRCDESIAFDPASSSPWAIKGFMLWPSDEGVACLRKAAGLGDKSYMTYYYLANAAMTRGDYQGCLDYARQAIKLGQHQDKDVKALLYQWAAISLAKLGGPPNEIEALFSEAVATAPDNAQAKESYREYRAKTLPEPPPIALRDPANALQIPVFAGCQMAVVA